MKQKLLQACVAVGLLALVFGRPALAAPIVVANVTDIDAGTWLYSYSLTNASDSGENVYDFGLDFFGDAFNLTQPDNWMPLYAAGTDTVPSFIDWFSADESSDLLPGGTLEFSFQSGFGPGDVVSHIATTVQAIDGTTTGPNPATVPEPGTLALLALGAAGLFVHRRRTTVRA